MNDMHPEQRHGCEFPDCEMLARSTPMALHVGDGEPHVVRLCARHGLLFSTGDAAVMAWLEAAPPSALSLALR